LLRIPILALPTHYLELLIKILAVVGGATVGGLAIGLLVSVLSRFLFSTKMPRPAVMLVRLLGGVACGLAVWLILSTPGGSGLFGGGSSLFGGPGVGTGQGTGKETTTGPTGKGKTTSRDQFPTAREGETLRVVMLGGNRVKEERFYRLEGEGEPLTLAALKKAVKERQRNAAVKGIDIVIYEDSVAKDHPAVRDLENWSRENDLTVSRTSLPGSAP
jgi:hypothetical protein